MTKEKELKPCPFCGEVPKMEISFDKMAWQEVVTFVCGTVSCPMIKTGRYHGTDYAIKAWNTRKGEK